MNSVLISVPTMQQRPLATRTMCAFDSLMSKYFHEPAPLERCGLTAQQVRNAMAAHSARLPQPQSNPYRRPDRRHFRPIDDNILEIIRNHNGRVTSGELEAETGMSRISIGRAITRLNDRGFQIYRDRTKKSSTYYMS